MRALCTQDNYTAFYSVGQSHNVESKTKFLLMRVKFLAVLLQFGSNIKFLRFFSVDHETATGVTAPTIRAA